jgi:hypothetical protein
MPARTLSMVLGSHPHPYPVVLNLIVLLSHTGVIPSKKHGPAFKKLKTYEALWDKGMSKQRAAGISNVQARKEKD